MRRAGRSRFAHGPGPAWLVRFGRVATAAPVPDTTPVLVELARSLGPAFAERQEWRAAAACRGQDPARWFPPRGSDHSELRAVCRDCQVRAACLEYALGGGADANGGIWAGTSARQRREIRRRGWSVDRALEWLDERG